MDSGDVMIAVLHTVERWTSYMFVPKAVVSRLALQNPETSACIPIRTDGHIWMLMHNKGGEPELFDPSGGIFSYDILPAIAHLAKQKCEYLPYNYQRSKEDKHCQTWIWYYAYCRIIRDEGYYAFHVRMMEHSIECNVAILRCFRDMLQSSRGGHPADFTVARLHEVEQATTTSACLWPDVSRITRRLHPSAFQ